MTITRILTGLTMAAFLLPGSSSARTRVAVLCPPEPAMAPLIAASDLILTARLAPDAAVIIGTAKVPGYVSIPLEAPTVLKGTRPEKLVLQHYADPQSSSPAHEALARASGKPATLFLVLAGGALYLASDPQFAIRGADAATVNAVRADLARQTAILRRWQIDRELPHFDQVGRLIHSLGERHCSSAA